MAAARRFPLASFAALIAFRMGATIGALAGYLRGPVELVLMRIAELFQTLPVVIVVLFIVAVLGASFWLLIGAVALAIWPLEARIVYGQFVTLSDRPFIKLSPPAPPTCRRHAIVLAMEILAECPATGDCAGGAGRQPGDPDLGRAGVSRPVGSQRAAGANCSIAARPIWTAAWWSSVPGVAICIAGPRPQSAGRRWLRTRPAIRAHPLQLRQAHLRETRSSTMRCPDLVALAPA